MTSGRLQVLQFSCCKSVRSVCVILAQPSVMIEGDDGVYVMYKHLTHDGVYVMYKHLTHTTDTL